MHQIGAAASTSSTSLKRHCISPEIPSAQPKQISRRPTKRARQSQETSQPTHTTQNTARPTSTSPGKPSRGHATARVPVASNPTTEASTTRPGVLQPVIIPQPSVVPHPHPILSGNFDLYGMYLPVLAKLYLPQGATSPDYSALYDRILASQARHDYTARCFLAPQDPNSFAPPHGRFESASVLDPVAERPFDVTLDAFTYQKSLTFTPTERLSFPAPEHNVAGPGLLGHTGLSPVCGIKNAKGILKIKRVWVKEQENSTKELFEGFFSFSASYDSMYRKAGRGNGAKWKFAFWGVRAMKDNTGKEIGLGPNKTMR